jgi:hypothetical protein
MNRSDTSQAGALSDAIILVVRCEHSHPFSAGTFAKVRIKGPLANIIASGALDLTFAYGTRGMTVANVKSAPLAGTPLKDLALPGERGKHPSLIVTAGILHRTG